MAVVFDQGDINGECFILGSEGEVEELLPINTVYFPNTVPFATDATLGQQIAFTGAQIRDFVKRNTYHLFHHGMPFNDALACAYIRYLCAREGLISHNFTLANHNVTINDSILMTAADDTNFANGLTNGNAGVFPDEVAFNLAWGASAAILNRPLIRRMFTDIVCCVAYVFRVRGHHYRAEFAARYTSLWQRCLHTAADLPTNWQNLATAATHAIFPDMLDRYWTAAVNASQCAGALIKRHDSAPAGAAGILALKRGLDDVCMIFPEIADRVPEAKQEFERVYAQIRGNRWAASINARYYGVNRMHFNESAFGALASVVTGVYDKLAPNAPLLDSPALQRLATIAPATGGAIGTAAAATAKSDQFLLLAPNVP